MQGVPMENKRDSGSGKTTILSNSIHKALHGKPGDLKEMHEMLQTLSYMLETLHLTAIEKIVLKHRMDNLFGIADAGGPDEYFHLIQDEILKHVG
jgi:hypothetical protein